jgi:hypothetical protein
MTCIVVNVVIEFLEAHRTMFRIFISSHMGGTSSEKAVRKAVIRTNGIWREGCSTDDGRKDAWRCFHLVSVCYLVAWCACWFSLLPTEITSTYVWATYTFFTPPSKRRSLPSSVNIPPG